MPHRVTFFCCYATIKSLLLCYAPKKQTTTIYKKGQREMRRNVCCSTTYYSELGSGALHSCPVYLPLHKNTYIVREFHCLISFGKIFYCRTVYGYACIYTLFIDMKWSQVQAWSSTNGGPIQFGFPHCHRSQYGPALWCLQKHKRNKNQLNDPMVLVHETKQKYV